MLFLLVAGAHEERMADLIRILFAIKLSFDAKGLRVTRRPSSPGAP